MVILLFTISPSVRAILTDIKTIIRTPKVLFHFEIVLATQGELHDVKFHLIDVPIMSAEDSKLLKVNVQKHNITFSEEMSLY